jgi:hypothetical protein
MRKTSLIEFMNFLTLRKLLRGCLEKRMALTEPVSISSPPSVSGEGDGSRRIPSHPAYRG